MQFKIGEFSDLAGISAKTLRHYEKLGLLQPSRVDARTRYRRYSSSQLQEISTIIALRDLGLTLSQIRSFVSRTMSQDARRQLLRSVRENLQHRIQNAMQTLKDIDATIEHEVDGPSRSTLRAIVIKQCPHTRIALLSTEMEGYVEAEVVRLERELRKTVPREFIGGSRGVLWQRRPNSDILLAEPFVEVTRALPYRSCYELRELPPSVAASTFCLNNDTAALKAYAAINAWMSARHLSLAGPKREIDLGDMLEIQAPLKI